MALPTLADEVIVAEGFNGDSSDLDGKTSYTFDAAIVTAGGSATWGAHADFDRDGSVAGWGLDILQCD